MLRREKNKMKTIGQLLKETRRKKKYSTDDIETKTKIKKEFIYLLENEAWERLPDYPTVQGFVRTISKELGINEEQSAALLRRDYPPKKLSVNPKPDVKDKRVWSPKKSFVLGISAVIIIVLGYLGVQYKKFVSPPNLVVINPVEGQSVSELIINISGETDSDAIVLANNQPILVDVDGIFSQELEIEEGTKEVTIKAISRSGKESVIRRKIEVDIKK